MEHPTCDFNWRIAYERLVEKVTDQLDLLEEPVLNGEISSATLYKIIKKLIQDEQNRASTSAESQLQSQPQPQSKPQPSSSSQTDCAETFKPVTVNSDETRKNVMEKENWNADSHPNPELETEISDMEIVHAETLNLDAEKIENANDAASPTAQTLNLQSQETDSPKPSNIKSTDSQTVSISDTPLEPNQNQNQLEQERQEKEKQLKSRENKKPFKCPKCPYWSKWKANVETHLKNVHTHKLPTPTGPFRPYACPNSECNYAALQKVHLTRHMTTHSDAKSFICSQPNCNFSTTRSDNLKIHTRNHTGEKPYVCQFQSCDFAATTSSHLVDHSRKHTGEKPFKCPERNCGYSAKRSSSITGHRRYHFRKRKAVKGVKGCPSFPCPHCEYSGESQILLSAHVKTHSFEKSFACSFESCTFRTKLKNNFIVHLKTHSDEKQYKCELCPFRAKTRGRVQIHIKNVHSDPKYWTFKCKEPTCDFAFRTRRHLERHLLTHSDKTTYACPFTGCDYLTLVKQQVKLHEYNVHSEEKKEKCSLCDYTCKTKFNLTSHMRTHTNEEPYKCKAEGCEYQAKQPSALKQHQKKHHALISN